MEQAQNNNVVLELVQVLWKHLLGMLIIFTSIMVVVIILTQMQIPVYEAASKVLVKFGREYVYRSMEGRTEGNVSPTFRFDPDEIINTSKQIITSGELVEEVLDIIGVEKIFPKMAQNAENKDFLMARAVDSFIGRLNVNQQKPSNVFTVTFQHQDPDVAALAVTTIIERFKKRHVEIYRNANVAFLEKKVAEVGKELQMAEEAKSKYQNNNRIILSLDLQRKIALEHFSGMNRLLIEETGNLQRLKEEKEYIEKATVGNEEQTLLSNVVEQRGNTELIELKLLDLKRQKRLLTDKYPEDNRLVLAVNAEIEQVNELLKAVERNKVTTVRTGKNEHFYIMQRELAAAEGKYNGQLKKVETIREQVASLKAELETLAKREMDIKRLDDNLQMAAHDYEMFRAKLVESRVQEVLDREEQVSVIVIDKARVPLRPIKPNKRMRIMVGLILAVASCFFYTLFREYIWVSKK